MGSVDVIVPCYRYGHFLRECVESVLTQSVDVRVLIIDDASPDNSAEVAAELAREDSRVSFLRHTNNKGHIATYNEGIEWASANYVLLLSADDYLLPGALSRAANLMDEYPEVGFCFSNFLVLKENCTARQIKVIDSISNKKGWRIFTGLEFIKLNRFQNIVAAPTAVVRLELQKRLGGYRPELPHSGDFEMWLRLAAHASVGFFEICQAVYRRHDSNMSLDYTMKSWLSDLQQRKTALDCFFQTCSHVQTKDQRLQYRLFFSLSCNAVHLASAAFNEGKIEISEELSEFALSVCPEAKKSLSWMKLAIKLRIGYKKWCMLHSIIPRIN